MTKTTEIVICEACDGKGYQYEHIMTCYHKGEYDVEYHLCRTCDGNGRLEKTTVVTYAPFIVPPIDIIGKK